MLPCHSAAVVRLPYDLWLVTGELGFHSRARTGWVSLAHWLGRIQPTQGMLRTHAAVWRPRPVWLVLHPVWGRC